MEMFAKNEEEQTWLSSTLENGTELNLLFYFI